MQVCFDCKKEMKCVKNGVQVTWNNGCHAYSGDAYTCPECGKTTINCNQTNHQIQPEKVEEHEKNLGQWFVRMDQQ